jgi:hypothetical protein
MPLARAQTPTVLLEDIFSRSLNGRGLTLVDWEGFIANPAIKFFVKPPTNTAFPASAVLRANGVRLYFDLPSQNNSNGATKTLSFANASTKVPVLLSIFPDRDTVDEDYTLQVEFTSNTGAKFTNSFPIHVVDHDRALTNVFNVTVDFGQDRTGFFADPNKRALAQQAADDMAYFIGEMNLNMVPAQSELTRIWETNGFVTGKDVRNSNAYRGFLLYAYGIRGPELRSGGEGSRGGGFQASGAIPLPLRRSGGYEAETAGNYNSLGWVVNTNENDWWVPGNRRRETNDLASIAHHEIGHALFFNTAYTRFSQAKRNGFITSSNLLAYLGTNVPINASDHFAGSIDPASRKGVFGYEYFGDMPRRRWLWTKLDVLCAEAVGYPLRHTTPLQPVSILTSNLPPPSQGIPYSQSLMATGGVPVYAWEIASGTLPPGLALDSFTGVISGTPTQTNAYSFTIRLRDYLERTNGITRLFSIKPLMHADGR